MSDESSILTHLDCFSGLGAWTLAASWLGGIRTVAFVENDARCKAFLAKAWPGIQIEPDIRTLDGSRYRGVDILTGGVPCQPASRAGKQAGANDDRWLWPATLRVIGQARPRCCILENPPGISDVGLDGILAALESQGYEIAPIFDIPACAVDSPQLRHRYYIVAFARCLGSGQDESQWEPQGGNVNRRAGATNGGVGQADASESRQQGPDTELETDGRRAEHHQGDMANQSQLGRETEPSESRARRQPAECDSGNLGNAKDERIRTGLCDSQPVRLGRSISPNPDFWSDYVWLPCADGKIRRSPGDSVGLVDGLHRSILGALGNSQVPQVAYEILRAVQRALTEARHD